MRRIGLLLTVFSSLLAPDAALADVDLRVGAGPGCLTSSIQAAIDLAVPANGVTRVLIARNASYGAQALDIDGKQVHLLGGYDTCQSALPGVGRTVIDGAGGAARSILRIRGASTVVLANLEFTGGDAALDGSSYGGAIDVTGGPHVIDVDNVSIRGNRAGLGGGLAIRSGSSTNLAHVRVRLGPNVAFTSNTAAFAGGGMYCRGATVETLEFAVMNTLFLLNQATGAGSTPGHGGGLFVDECMVRLGSSREVGFNQASGSGGGIYATGSRATVDLFTVDAQAPLRIAGNTAGRYGGAIDVETGANVRAWSVVIENNRATQGGGAIAMYSGGSPSDLTLRGDLEVGAPIAARRCDPGIECNVIRGNQARDGGGTGQEGSALRVSIDGGSTYATLSGTRITGNEGNATLWTTSDGGLARLTVEGALVDGNASGEELVRFEDVAVATTTFQTVLRGTTIAANAIAAARVIGGVVRCGSAGATPHPWTVEGSIVWQPGKQLLAPVASGTQCVRHSVVNDLSNVPSANLPLNRTADPLFVGTGDFNVRPGSPAVDFSSIVGGVTRDGALRIVDQPDVADVFGPQDAGAFERGLGSPQPQLFNHGFED
jgi:hypothetical protein